MCKHSRYLESSRSKHSGPLIFSHVRCCDPPLVCLLALSCRQDLHILLIFLLTRPKQTDLQHSTASQSLGGSHKNEKDMYYHPDGRQFQLQHSLHLQRFPDHLILHPPRRHQNLHHRSYKCKKKFVIKDPRCQIITLGGYGG